MSKVGKKPILIPESVEVKIEDQKITVRGPKGELSREVRPEIQVGIKEGKVSLVPKFEERRISAFWGLERALISNMVKGVVEGFEKKLEIQGIGYKATLDGRDLILETGFTHSTRVNAPEDITFSIEKNIITVSGIDKGKVSQLAAKIRKVKPPDLYKGKGIRYLGEEIKLKPGKKAVTAAA